MRPLGKGIPKIPATPVVRPRRKISQWNPAGLRRGNSVPCAINEETKNSLALPVAEIQTLRRSGTIVIKIKENSQQHGERYGEEYIGNVHIPEVDKPAAIHGWEKGFACW